jgi:ADP-ribosyl-[dinitrogen reductase] hydrolase
MSSDMTYQVTPGFMVGPHPGRTGGTSSATRVAFLLREGVRCIIDLTSPADALVMPEECMKETPNGVVVHSFPIPDMGVPSVPLMLAILDCIDNARSQQQPIYLHCAAGIGRSGMVVACWLIRRGAAPSAALAQLATLRGALHAQAPAPEAPEQVAFVLHWREPDGERAGRIRAFRDRYRGALLGLAVGDCLGMPLEFKSPNSRILSGMEDGNAFDVPIGSWTDDTSMALCLADSILSTGGFDPHDQMQRYSRWWHNGLWSSVGRCFDIGLTVADALRAYRSDGEAYLGSTDPYSAGNGSLMRLAPIPMAFGYDAALCDGLARDSSRTTHGAPTALDACAVYAHFVAAALRGTAREVFFGSYAGHVGTTEISAVLGGSYRAKSPPEIVGSGYVVKSMEAALWAFARNNTYATATLDAANLAHDADTTAAICGMLAGAYWGESAIPSAWLDVIARRRDIEWLAEALLAYSWDEWAQHV